MANLKLNGKLITLGGKIIVPSGGAPTPSSSFDIGTGFDLIAWPMLIDSNDKIYVGGQFSTYKDLSQNGLIRLNTDGTKDTGFNIGTGFSGDTFMQISAIKIDSNGKIYVGGLFNTYNGTTENFLIRLNDDGTKDTGFDIGTGFNNTVLCLNIDQNGKIYVGGNFTTFNGSTIPKGLIRLNDDGTKDTGFNVGAFSASATIYSLFVDVNNKLYVGGIFSTYSGTSQRSLIRLNDNGTKDTGFNIGTGFGITGVIYSIKNDINGKIYVGGAYTAYKGISQNRLIRLNDDGTKDTAFDVGTGFDSDVFDVKIDSNNKIYVSGFFSTYQDLTENYLIRLNDDGTKDTGFNIDTGFDMDTFSMDIDSNGKLFVCGDYTSYKGISQNRLIKLNTDGTKA